jgi:RNA polymerase sigma-70 factor (ECF subfamily)
MPVDTLPLRDMSLGFGDPLEELDALQRTQRGALLAAARNEGVSPEDALECVQDALCTWLRAERDGELPPARPSRIAAAFTMVRNAARNERRRHHRSKPHLPLERGDGMEWLPGDAPDAESLLTHAEETVRLRACLATLCGAQRAVVTLRLLEERSGEDVAHALGLSRGYVDVLVHRAKASLRACMRG